MLAMLRIVVVEWILARIGLRWLIGLLIAVPAALIFFIGIPTLLIGGVVVFFAWRFIAAKLRESNPPTHPSAPDAAR